MWKNHLLVALRNLRRERGYTLITLSGLAVGIACCLVILLYVRTELRYDRHHEHAGNVYRVATERTFPNRTLRSARTPRPMAAALAADVPEVVRATRLSRERAERVLVQVGDRRFFEDRVYFGDANVFDVFSLPLLRGTPATALTDPFSIVLSETTARTYFGDQDPIGQSLTLRLAGDRTAFDYRVTGVMEDMPATGHFHADLLVSYARHPLVGDPDEQNNWLGLTLYTYVRLRPGTRPETVEAKLPDLVETYALPQLRDQTDALPDSFRAGRVFHYFLQPLTDLHLYSNLQNELEPPGSIAYVTLFAAIAGFILLLACVNFINLTTARSMRRAREVGVRKALGAYRGHLVRQFLAESMLLSLLAVLLALALVEGLVPVFNALVDASLTTWSGIDGLIGLGLPVLVVLVGLLAGSYPAFYLSSFRPAAVLRGGSLRTGSRSVLRNSLVVFQFAVSIALLAGTAVVYAQLGYVRHKALGFNRDHVVVLEGTEVLGSRMDAFVQALRDQPAVEAAANGQTVPGRPVGRTLVRTRGADDEEQVSVSWLTAGVDFAETLGVTVREGRLPSGTLATDSMSVLLNEAAVQALNLDDPVGTTLVENGRAYTVIGVVQDFHFSSLHQEIEPFALFGPDPFNQNRPNQVVAVRIQADDLPATLARLAHTWRAFVPDQPFSYTFLDATVEALYRADRRTGRLIAAFAVLAVGIACLGLFGLAAFTAEQRTREIGIRKVFGAGVPHIVLLLSKEFTLLVLLAFALAAPPVYLGMHRWLQTFAYRIEMSGWTFLSAGLIALLVAVLTVGHQALKAALADPVRSLRSL